MSSYIPKLCDLQLSKMYNCYLTATKYSIFQWFMGKLIVLTTTIQVPNAYHAPAGDGKHANLLQGQKTPLWVSGTVCEGMSLQPLSLKPAAVPTHPLQTNMTPTFLHLCKGIHKGESVGVGSMWQKSVSSCVGHIAVWHAFSVSVIIGAQNITVCVSVYFLA